MDLKIVGSLKKDVQTGSQTQILEPKLYLITTWRGVVKGIKTYKNVVIP